MPGIQVVTDSACDLPDEVIDKLGIQVVPLTIRFGNEEFVDRVELSPKEFWDRVLTGPAHAPDRCSLSRRLSNCLRRGSRRRNGRGGLREPLVEGLRHLSGSENRC